MVIQRVHYLAFVKIMYPFFNVILRFVILTVIDIYGIIISEFLLINHPYYVIGIGGTNE